MSSVDEVKEAKDRPNLERSFLEDIEPFFPENPLKTDDKRKKAPKRVSFVDEDFTSLRITNNGNVFYLCIIYVRSAYGFY